MGAKLLTFINQIVAFLVWPFTLLPVWLGLFAISVLAGMGLLWIYGKVSNQKKIRYVKGKIYASLLESILFRHDVWLTLKAQGKMLFYGARYFTLAIFPVLILAVPCILLLSELNEQYATKSLDSKSEAIVQMTLTDASKLYEVKLDAPVGLDITPPVRIPSTKQIFWKIKTTDAGDQKVNFQIADFNLPKTLFIGTGVNNVGAVWQSSWSDKLLYPAGPASIPYVKSLTINYPEQLYSLGFFETNWLIFFLIFSMISGIVVSKYLGVAI